MASIAEIGISRGMWSLRTTPTAEATFRNVKPGYPSRGDQVLRKPDNRKPRERAQFRMSLW
jgi:hypothetical protein